MNKKQCLLKGPKLPLPFCKPTPTMLCSGQSKQGFSYVLSPSLLRDKIPHIYHLLINMHIRPSSKSLQKIENTILHKYTKPGAAKADVDA